MNRLQAGILELAAVERARMAQEKISQLQRNWAMDRTRKRMNGRSLEEAQEGCRAGYHQGRQGRLIKSHRWKKLKIAMMRKLRQVTSIRAFRLRHEEGKVPPASGLKRVTHLAYQVDLP